MDDLNDLPAHEKLGLTLCAYRLALDISAVQFVEVLERYERAIRKDERRKCSSGSAGNG